MNVVKKRESQSLLQEIVLPSMEHSGIAFLRTNSTLYEDQLARSAVNLLR